MRRCGRSGPFKGNLLEMMMLKLNCAEGGVGMVIRGEGQGEILPRWQHSISRERKLNTQLRA